MVKRTVDKWPKAMNLLKAVVNNQTQIIRIKGEIVVLTYVNVTFWYGVLCSPSPKA